MGTWTKADECTSCAECDSPIQEGEEFYLEADDAYCEGCQEDRQSDDDWEEDLNFAEPGGRSALRAASEDNPRNLPCPTCNEPNRLTPVDKQLGYQCDTCADRDEGLAYG